MSESLWLIIDHLSAEPTPPPFAVVSVTRHDSPSNYAEKSANTYSTIEVSRTALSDSQPKETFDVKIGFIKSNTSRGRILGYYNTYREAMDRMNDLCVDFTGRDRTDNGNTKMKIILSPTQSWFFEVVEVILPPVEKTPIKQEKPVFTMEERSLNWK